MSNWNYIEGNEENLKSMPSDRDFEVLFDNGMFSNYYSDELPFSEIIAWREISNEKPEEELKEFICEKYGLRLDTISINIIRDRNNKYIPASISIIIEGKEKYQPLEFEK